MTVISIEDCTTGSSGRSALILLQHALNIINGDLGSETQLTEDNMEEAMNRSTHHHAPMKSQVINRSSRRSSDASHTGDRANASSVRKGNDSSANTLHAPRRYATSDSFRAASPRKEWVPARRTRDNEDEAYLLEEFIEDTLKSRRKDPDNIYSKSN